MGFFDRGYCGCMGWSGIWLVRVPEGVTPEEAVAATLVSGDEAIAGGSLDNPIDTEPHSSSATVPPLVDADNQWRHQVRRALLKDHPRLEETNHWGVLADQNGPVTLVLYPDQVHLEPKKRWREPADEDGA